MQLTNNLNEVFIFPNKTISACYINSTLDPDSTGLNPSWRRAISEVVIGVSWDEGSTADFISQQIDQLKEMILILDELTTDSGSYFNEVNRQFSLILKHLNFSFLFFFRIGSLHELDFEKSHFGDHYDKLVCIKKKYYPTSLFIVASGVGSDKWNEQLVCRRQI